LTPVTAILVLATAVAHSCATLAPPWVRLAGGPWYISQTHPPTHRSNARYISHFVLRQSPKGVCERCWIDLRQGLFPFDFSSRQTLPCLLIFHLQARIGRPGCLSLAKRASACSGEYPPLAVMPHPRTPPRWLSQCSAVPISDMAENLSEISSRSLVDNSEHSEIVLRWMPGSSDPSERTITNFEFSRKSFPRSSP